MNPKKNYILLLALLTVTALLTMWYLTTRDAVPEKTVRVTWAGKTIDLDAAKLNREPVKGTLVNGKGQERTVDTMGLSLAQVLSDAHVDVDAIELITVTAQDAFSAQVTGDEIRQEGKAYLILEEDDVVLVVFGDTNSKRNVRQVAQIDVQ